MTFESEGLLIVAIYIWLPPASYVVFSDNSGSFIVLISVTRNIGEILLLHLCYLVNLCENYLLAIKR